ncbi:MAG: GMC family oxidoreductase N-terminal domain-containing protein [Rhodobacter sp.]|nr:GMC family oxidoreductase N-terminal domain-containing protein [Rhodobacter sp.]
MQSDPSYDVIVVGAGAAGAVMAARIAEGGKSVLVLEAGPDPLDPKSQVAGARDLRADYNVPAFNAFASENPGMNGGDLWVRHYSNTDSQKRDPKFDKALDGVLYPRVKGLGGCSAHHAMIIVKPRDGDWNHIAQATGDASWSAGKMQKYWERVERCRHRLFTWRWLAKLTGWNPTGHGWWGWLQTEYAMPLQVLRDRTLRRDILRSIGAASDAYAGTGTDFQTTSIDPNERRLWNAGACGVRLTPMSTRRHTRTGARERLLAAMGDSRNRVTLKLEAEVLRVEVVNSRAEAVVYEQDGKQYRASGTEIVLCGGAFRTPQMLMLSGIGPADHLKRHGIAPVLDLPGVGENLQDRYEIAVANEMVEPWSALNGVEYSTSDRPYRLWKKWRRGPYKSNGAVLAVELKSRPELTAPDLFCFSVLVNFQGYYRGYSEDTRPPNYMTWAILKAYTSNTAGSVQLRSSDPGDPPDVQFRYFDEGSPGWQDDLDAVVTGVRFVRKITDSMERQVKREVAPGRTRSSDTALREFVRDNAWGHHACGTCAMKPSEQGGVVDSRFRVHGLQGLRVVDASIFPRIPGYFLVSSVYMIAEKAADTILEDLA